MGNRHVHEIECLQRLGTSEFGRQKGTALNLFYPTASPPLYKKPAFWHCDTASKGGACGSLAGQWCCVRRFRPAWDGRWDSIVCPNVRFALWARTDKTAIQFHCITVSERCVKQKVTASPLWPSLPESSQFVPGGRGSEPPATGSEPACT